MMAPLLIACETILLLVTASNSREQDKMPDLPSQARRLVHELASDNIASVRRRFSPIMSRSLSEEQLRQMWLHLVGRIGTLQEVASVRETMEGGFRLVYVTGRFNKGYMDIKVAFDHNGQVTGLFFVPAVIWKTPKYANQREFEERLVSVITGEFRLPGTLTMPKAGGNWPAIVLVHGSGPHDRDETIGPNKPFKDIAWGLATRGIVVLRYDKRTFRYGSKSVSNPLELTVKQETIEDAISALRLLAQTDGVDPTRLYVLGHSLGGMLAPRIAAAANPKPSGLIIFAGNARPLEVLLLEQLIYLAERDGNVDVNEQHLIDTARRIQERISSPDFQPTEMIDLMGSKLPGGYFLDLHRYDPIVVAQEIKMPMLVLRGERDYQVTNRDQQMWREGLRDLPEIEFHTYKQLNHLFMKGEGLLGPEQYLREGHVDVRVIDDLTKWINEQRVKGLGSVQDLSHFH